MRVIANIWDSLRSRPRDLTIVFGNPGNFEAQVRDVAWLVKRAEFKRYPGVGYAIYEATIADSKGERSIGSGQLVRQAL